MKQETFAVSAERAAVRGVALRARSALRFEPASQLDPSDPNFQNTFQLFSGGIRSMTLSLKFIF